MTATLSPPGRKPRRAARSARLEKITVAWARALALYEEARQSLDDLHDLLACPWAKAALLRFFEQGSAYVRDQVPDEETAEDARADYFYALVDIQNLAWALRRDKAVLESCSPAGQREVDAARLSLFVNTPSEGERS